MKPKNEQLIKINMTEIKEHDDENNITKTKTFKDSEIYSKHDRNERIKESLVTLNDPFNKSITNSENPTFTKNENDSVRNSTIKPISTNKKEPKHKIKAIKEIQDIVGMIKLKFHPDRLDNLMYQPWDCCAISENKMENYYKNFEKRKQLVDHCKDSLIKVYPSAGRFDSSNFDPVKSWICGVQIAALNFQSLHDDSMLINKVFFRMNGGSGFILKPDFLRNGEYEKNYFNPVMKIKLSIIAGHLLQNCNTNNKDISDISVMAYLVGCWEDDYFNNNKFSTKKIKQNLINPIFDNESTVFDVYEKDLSFLIFKLYAGANVLARSCVPLSTMMCGLRSVPLYDHNVNQIPDASLIVRIKMTDI